MQIFSVQDQSQDIATYGTAKIYESCDRNPIDEFKMPCEGVEAEHIKDQMGPIDMKEL